MMLLQGSKYDPIFIGVIIFEHQVILVKIILMLFITSCSLFYHPGDADVILMSGWYPLFCLSTSWYFRSGGNISNIQLSSEYHPDVWIWWWRHQGPGGHISNISHFMEIPQYLQIWQWRHLDVRRCAIGRYADDVNRIWQWRHQDVHWPDIWYRLSRKIFLWCIRLCRWRWISGWYLMWR